MNAHALSTSSVTEELEQATPEPRFEGKALLTIKETAEYLDSALPTIYYWAQREMLPGAFKIQGKWRVRKADLDRSGLRKDLAQLNSCS